MFSVVKTCSLNCPKVLFYYRLIREALLFLWNTIFPMKPCTRKGFLPLKNGKIDGRNYADLEGSFIKVFKKQIEIF